MWDFSGVGHISIGNRHRHIAPFFCTFIFLMVTSGFYFCSMLLPPIPDVCYDQWSYWLGLFLPSSINIFVWKKWLNRVASGEWEEGREGEKQGRSWSLPAFWRLSRSWWGCVVPPHHSPLFPLVFTYCFLTWTNTNTTLSNVQMQTESDRPQIGSR